MELAAKITIIAKALMVGLFSVLFLNCAGQTNSHWPASQVNQSLEAWQRLRFGAFVHFNDNAFVGQELSKNTDVNAFNPDQIGFDAMIAVFQQSGIKYAVLTTRHTSGFCLWNSKTTQFNVMNSPYHQDLVKQFVDACRKYNIKPCFYYCLWGGKDWNPGNWNPTIKAELKGKSPKEIILNQLTELAANYGDIYEFWMDMQCWSDTSLTSGEIYDLLKQRQPKAFVHFNQHVQDGQKITYFPTDILNGEERIPPVSGHNPLRTVGGRSYYLPFEYEITSQRCDSRSLGNGLMTGSVWFTYPDSQFYPVDSLFSYIKTNYDRGGSTVLLSTAPDNTGMYRKADADSLLKLGKMITTYWKNKEK